MQFLKLDGAASQLYVNVATIEAIEGHDNDKAAIWCTGSENAYRVKQTVAEVRALILMLDKIEIASVPVE